MRMVPTLGCPRGDGFRAGRPTFAIRVRTMPRPVLSHAMGSSRTVGRHLHALLDVHGTACDSISIQPQIFFQQSSARRRRARPKLARRAVCQPRGLRKTPCPAEMRRAPAASMLPSAARLQRPGGAEEEPAAEEVDVDAASTALEDLGVALGLEVEIEEEGEEEGEGFGV